MINYLNIAKNAQMLDKYIVACTTYKSFRMFQKWIKKPVLNHYFSTQLKYCCTGVLSTISTHKHLQFRGLHGQNQASDLQMLVGKCF